MGKFKALVFLLVAVGAIVGGGAVAMRVGRDRFSAPVEVRPDLAFTTQMGSIYQYAARVGDRVILFDTGADPAAAATDALLAHLKRKHGDVKDIFLTHAHFDHLAGALQFPEARIHLGSGDIALASGKASPDALAAKVMTAVMAVPPLPRVTNPLSGKTTIDVGGGKTVVAYPMPGHTRGSFAFLYDGVLFPGDTMVFKEGRLDVTPSLFDAHPEENKAAIRALKKQLGDETIDRICTAHGGCTPKELGNNLLNDFVQRLGG